jgi:hypothetical protein
MVERGATLATEQSILESLRIKPKTTRYSTIPDAHAETFRWIFKDSSRGSRSPLTFLPWLRSENGIYWITGKAGSGKTTLMKYICDHQITIEALKTWAAPKSLVTASYFFWNAGERDQKSKKGLLQSLLYDILKQCPWVIPTVSPSRWEADDLFHNNPDPWTVSELSEAFTQLTQQSISKLRFCFFIDGLDEYEGDNQLDNLEDDRKLIDIIKALGASSDIKCCLSSRTWPEFQEAFGGDPDRKLMLQDVTREDIYLYVSKELGDNPDFKKIKEKDTRVQALFDKLVSKSEGVFLWVFLVVRDLNTALSHHISIDLLETTLDGIPSELTKYFELILNNVPEIYRQQAAQIFQMTLASAGQLPLMTFSYLDENDPDYAINADIQAWDENLILERCEGLRDQFNARCKDLLEVFTDPTASAMSRYKVGFLHRTVKDFLMEKETQRLLESQIRIPFDANVYLCRAFLAQMKLLPIQCQFLVNRGPLFYLVDDFMYSANKIEKTTNDSCFSLLQEVDRVLLSHAQVLSRSAFSWHRWTALGLENEYREGWILTIAIQWGLRRYVTEVLDRKLLKQKSILIKKGIDGRPLLAFALRLPLSLQSNHDLDVDTDMVELLLTRGAKPDDGYDGMSVWGHFLLSIYRRGKVSDNTRKQWYRIIKILLCHDADPEFKGATGRTGPKPTIQGPVRYVVYSTASEIIEKVCLRSDSELLQEILQERKQLRWNSGLLGYLATTLRLA